MACNSYQLEVNSFSENLTRLKFRGHVHVQQNSRATSRPLRRSLGRDFLPKPGAGAFGDPCFRDYADIQYDFVRRGGVGGYQRYF